MTAAKRPPRRKHWSDRLKELGACREAVRWARRQPSLAVAWRECAHWGWMLWLIACRDDDLHTFWRIHAAVMRGGKRSDIIRRHMPRPPRLPAKRRTHA